MFCQSNLHGNCQCLASGINGLLVIVLTDHADEVRSGRRVLSSYLRHELLELE